MENQIREALKKTFIVQLKYVNYFNQRSEIFKKSIASLIETTISTGAKIVLVDNGEDEEQFCLDLFHNKKIHAYIRLNNIGLQGINAGFEVGMSILPDAEFFCFAGDDILFQNGGWLEECLSILTSYPDTKIIASPVHTAYHLRGTKWNRGKLSGGHILNERAGANVRVFRIADFLKIGKFGPPIPGNFAANGVEFTDRFVKLKYLSALTLKPMAKDMCAKNVRHAYPGQKGEAIVNLLGNSKLDFQTGLYIGSDVQRVQGKLVYGEIGCFMLYKYSNLFLHWLNEYGASTGLISKLYGDRVRITQRVLDPQLNQLKFDFVYIDTGPDVKVANTQFNTWFPRLNTGGILLCYLHKQIRSTKLLQDLRKQGYSICNKTVAWKLAKD
jgi:hypothetical protein